MLVHVRARLLNNTRPFLKNSTQKYTVPAVSTNESEEVKYPEILDLSMQAKVRRKHEAWHNKVKRLQTVEEKLFEINMPRYYGWRVLNLTEEAVFYNSLDMIQYYTRTHIMSEPGLPKVYDDLVSSEDLDKIVETVKPQIQEAIMLEYSDRKREQELTKEQLETKGTKEYLLSNAVARHINRILLANLSSKLKYLLEAQVDFNPRIETFWFAGGMNPPERFKEAKAKFSDQEDFINACIDIPVCYKGDPLVQLRHSLPLKEIVSLSESENPSYTVPQFKFDPRVLGYKFDRRHATCIPGFWPGDHCEFGLLSYHHPKPLNLLDQRPLDDPDEVRSVHAILASYGWLFPQACYQGFSTFQDVTYPFVTQTVSTDGQSWSFFVYQLNTTLLHGDNADKNPRANLLWFTKPEKLFEGVENKQICGFNDNVLKTLIKFYMYKPEEKVGVDMKPYLGETEKLIADIEEDERRDWLERHYKHLVTNRPRHRRIPEVFAWERIYMPQNYQIPVYRKLEYYRILKDTWKRRLDDHAGKYVPRCKRDPRPTKKKIGRFEKTYYPK